MPLQATKGDRGAHCVPRCHISPPQTLCRGQQHPEHVLVWVIDGDDGTCPCVGDGDDGGGGKEAVSPTKPLDPRCHLRTST